MIISFRYHLHNGLLSADGGGFFCGRCIRADGEKI